MFASGSAAPRTTVGVGREPPAFRDEEPVLQQTRRKQKMHPELILECGTPAAVFLTHTHTHGFVPRCGGCAVLGEP